MDDDVREGLITLDIACQMSVFTFATLVDKEFHATFFEISKAKLLSDGHDPVLVDKVYNFIMKAVEDCANASEVHKRQKTRNDR